MIVLSRFGLKSTGANPWSSAWLTGFWSHKRSPGEAKGAHDQRNAESTRVFGAAEGRPDRVSFPTDSQAQLLYHVLVAGQVDLPLILSLSDVGEQVAWNGFLVQRDISRAFNRSLNSWRDITHRGRLLVTGYDGKPYSSKREN